MNVLNGILLRPKNLTERFKLKAYVINDFQKELILKFLVNFLSKKCQFSLFFLRACNLILTMTYRILFVVNEQ